MEVDIAQIEKEEVLQGLHHVEALPDLLAGEAPTGHQSDEVLQGHPDLP